MLISYNYEAKTKDEAISKCLEDLNCKEEEIYIQTKETEKTLFKAKKVEIIVYKKEDIIGYIKTYIKTLGQLMNLDINMEIRSSDDVFNVQLISENNSILIGKEGRTITAIQTVLRQSVYNNYNLSIKVNVDVSNYKGKRIDRIEREVKKIIKEILTTKIDVTLDPMNSYERRSVHFLVSKHENLETESVGEGQDRHIVIKYKEK